MAARERFRVARALDDLPQTSAAFARGEITYSKVRAITRIATPDTDELLTGWAKAATASQLEKLVRKTRGAIRMQEAEEAQQSYRNRYVRWFYDEDGTMSIHARLPAEEGQLVVNALRELAETLGEERTEEYPVATDGLGQVSEIAQYAEHVNDIWPARRADALRFMAESVLAHGAAPMRADDRHQVVVHADADLLAGSDGGRCHIDDGPSLAVDTALRLACDARLQLVVEDADGNPLDVGRKTRRIPPRLRTALEQRDGGCRFPGCGAKRFVDAHHVRHWAEGGETSIDNPICHCRTLLPS